MQLIINQSIKIRNYFLPWNVYRLEVLSQPAPKGPDGKPVTTGEYFVEADERHYRKKVDYGRVVFKTKHVYTGNFQDWYFQGPGRYCWQDGTVYQVHYSARQLYLKT